jgi:hypothetical protein
LEGCLNNGEAAAAATAGVVEGVVARARPGTGLSVVVLWV